MRPTDLIALALAALAAHRLRSALTLLGIAVGIAAVILLTSIGEGIHRYVLAEFSQFGSNVIAIQPGKTRTGGVVSGLPTSARPLLPEDAQAIARLTDVVAVTPSVWGNAEVSGNGRLRRTTVYGVGPDMLRVFNGRLASGRFLPAEEVGSERALVVLGAKLERELFGSAGALGARLAIGNMQFRVIGVLAPKGQFLGIDLDDTAFIPASRALELFNRVGVNEIDVVFREGASASRVEAQLRDFMRARHGREDFTLVSQQEMLSTLSDILDVLTLAVGALGGISLLVGGVGIFTIMTIAVTERTSEIGLLVTGRAPPQRAHVVSGRSRGAGRTGRRARARRGLRHRTVGACTAAGAAGAYAGGLRVAGAGGVGGHRATRRADAGAPRRAARSGGRAARGMTGRRVPVGAAGVPFFGQSDRRRLAG